MSKVVIIAGSKSDESHVGAIMAALRDSDLEHDVYYASAHKDALGVVEIVGRYGTEENVVFITVTGLSNALSGVVACNTKHPVVACPHFPEKTDYLIDIHSTLRMPSKVPVLTVLRPDNCALAVKRILGERK